METESSTTVRVAYCVEISAPDSEEEYSEIDWIDTLERLERFVESYGNEDGHVCTVPSLFALAAQAVTTDNEELQAALPSAIKEDVEHIREVYPILVEVKSGSYPYTDGEESFREFIYRFNTITSKVLGKIFGRDDHGLEFVCIGHTNDAYDFEAKLFLIHDIRFMDFWHSDRHYHGDVTEVNAVPLSLPSVEPTVGVSMEHVLSVVGMKAVDEPGWKVITDHYHEERPRSRREHF
jgi:hypothetical protein